MYVCTHKVNEICSNRLIWIYGWLIMQYSSTVYRDYGGYIGISCPKLSPQNQLNIYFVTFRQYRLGIAKLKNVFRSFLTYSKKLLRILKFSI